MPSTKNLINPQLLAYYLTYQFVPKPFHLSLHRQQETTLNFPHKPGKLFLKNEKWIARNLHARLNNIMATTLEQTARPVGLLLSGGIDSTILLHLLRKNTKRQIHTITGAYASDTAHLKLCRLLAHKYKTIHEECIIYPKDLQKLPGLYSKGRTTMRRRLRSGRFGRKPRGVKQEFLSVFNTRSKFYNAPTSMSSYLIFIRIMQ